ncbi:hypothetical protein HDU89_002727 [Geranomyces variabilis]|nr:hypothetical protein HDU89_002727 [Geranomyces variabilis]
MLFASLVVGLAGLAPSALAAPVDLNATVVNIDLPPYFRTMGGFTPWAPNTQGYGIAEKLPVECTVDQVTLLSRHGMRYASAGTGRGTQAVVDRIRNATFDVRDPALAFLKTHRYDLPVEQLTDWGRRDLVLAGQTFTERYATLIAGNKKSVPLRTTTQSRMFDSATSFAQGFTQAQPGTHLEWTVVPDASPAFNTTLAVGTCKADKLGIYAPVTNILPTQWAAVYVPPIAARLNAALPGLNLTDNEVMSLQSGCPFETVAHNAVSPLCGIFTPSEWADYSYYQDLQQFTSAGYGGPLGRAWGVGWVNELLARLTDSPVVDHTSTNTTMDANPATFPLGRSVYLDFAHDTQLNSAIAVLGLLRDKEGVITGSARNEDRKWKIPSIAEMGGRLWVERVVCKSQPTARNKCSPEAKLNGTFVRLVLNHAVLPLDIAPCTTNAARAKDAGLCMLNDFVESQSFARAGGSWVNCDYTTLDEWKAAGSPM